MLCSSIPKRQGNTKFNELLKISLLFFLQHPQFVQSPIANYCLTFSLDVHAETQLVPKLLLHVYIQELRNIMVIPP